MIVDAYESQREILRSGVNKIFRLCEEKKVDSEIVDELQALKRLLDEEDSGEMTEMSAQFSVYPLRQPKLSPTIKAGLDTLTNFGLKVIPGSMSTLVIGEENKLWHALYKVYSAVSLMGELVMIVTFSNACPKPG